MRSRILAALALLLCGGAAILVVVTVWRQFPRGLLMALILWASVAAAWSALHRRGFLRKVGLAASAVLLVVAVVLTLTGGVILEGLIAVALLLGGLAAAKAVFALRVSLPVAPRPARPVVVYNPRSGGGKAVSTNLAAEARARGIEPIELRPGDDLVQLVLDAVARGADALAAAGGDGTQALVATIAAEHDLPFACIPAGTRNHFALDLGVDRDDVVGALDAFVDGGERRVDLAEVNGRVFVNNVSLGVYAAAVQRPGYRAAKTRSILESVADVVGGTSGSDHQVSWTDPDGAPHASAAVILVSNNHYRLGNALGSGTRPRLDTGRLGVAVLGVGAAPERPAPSSRWIRWTTERFDVDSSGPVPAGVDGEALYLEPPVRFVSRPGALRVRISPRHPGVSPSAAQPEGLPDAVGQLVRIALGTQPVPGAVGAHGRVRPIRTVRLICGTRCHRSTALLQEPPVRRGFLQTPVRRR